jgi:hypothetical protein
MRTGVASVALLSCSCITATAFVIPASVPATTQAAVRATSAAAFLKQHTAFCGCSICRGGHSATCSCAACSRTVTKLMHSSSCSCADCSCLKHSASCGCSACSTRSHSASCRCSACSTKSHSASCRCTACNQGLRMTATAQDVSTSFDTTLATIHEAYSYTPKR